MSNPLVYGLTATVVIIGAAALFMSDGSKQPNNNKPAPQPQSMVSPLSNVDWYGTHQPPRRTANRNSRVANTEDGHGILGLTPPPEPHQWTAYACTYLKAGGIYELIPTTDWFYLEAKLLRPGFYTYETRRVPKPTQDQLSKCGTEEDLHKWMVSVVRSRPPNAIPYRNDQ